MRRRQFGSRQETVPAMGLGALEIGRDWGPRGEGRARPGEEQAFALLKTALEAGIDLWDTAPAYQLSEARIGAFLKKNPVEVFLSTKTGELFDENGKQYYDFTAAGTDKFIKKSLEKLGRRIDALFIHCGPDEEEVVKGDAVFSAMDKARSDGNVRYLGVSPNTIRGLRLTVESGRFDAVQMNFNAFEQEAAPMIERAAQKGMAVFIRGALAIGFATDRAKKFRAGFPDLESEFKKISATLSESGIDFREALFRFAAWQPGATVLLSGTKHPEHLLRNAQWVDKGALPPAVHKLIKSLSKWKPVLDKYYEAIFSARQES